MNNEPLQDDSLLSFGIIPKLKMMAELEHEVENEKMNNTWYIHIHKNQIKNTFYTTWTTENAM